MRVRVRVRDHTLTINVGQGSQRLKWLAVISLQRYEETIGEDSGEKVFSSAHVATGIMDAAGTLLPPNKSIRVALEDMEEVFVLVQADDDPKGADAKGARGTSKFLMAQGAAPTKCIIHGPSNTVAHVGQANFFYITARDAYGNLSRNGGEFFDVKFEGPEPPGPNCKQSVMAAAGEHVPAACHDNGDGSYTITQTLAKRGKYEVSVNLDGEPIAGSPFPVVVVHPHPPKSFKWMAPRVSGTAPEKFAHGACVTFEQSLLTFGGVDGGVYSNDLRLLNTRSAIKFDTPKMAGKPPSPRAGCAAALSGYRLFLYGGEESATGPPLDELCCLDLEGASWQQLIGRGMSPGRLSFAAAASIGNKVYLFGGCTGEGVTNSFHCLDVVSTMWDPIESLTSQPPSPR